MGRALETDRLLLRPFRPEDRADCFAFLSDPETCHLDGGYEPFREMDRDYDALMEKLAGQEGRYMVEERASCRVVGTVHIFKDALRRVPAMEIGYVISPACRRRGYAAEAVERVIRYLFEETDTVLVTAGAAAGNAASLALLPGDEEAQRMALWSLADSLYSIGAVEELRLLADGEELEFFGLIPVESVAVRPKG